MSAGVEVLTRGYQRAAAGLSRGRDGALLFARLMLGWLMLLHALGKFTDPGGVPAFQHYLVMLGNVPFPMLVGAVLPWVEVVAAGMLIAGALTRLAALVLAAEMTIIAFLVKLGDGRTGVIITSHAPMPGAELDFLYLTGLVVLVLLGPGRVAADWLLRLEGGGRRARAARPAGDPAGIAS